MRQAPRLSWKKRPGAQAVRLQLASRAADGAGLRRRAVLGLSSCAAIALVALTSGTLSGFESASPRFTSLPEAPQVTQAVVLPPPAPVAAMPPVDQPVTAAAGPSSVSPTETRTPPPAAPLSVWREATVRQGDNLSTIFARLGLPVSDLHEMMALGESTAELKRLHPGQVLRFRMVDGVLSELVYQDSITRALHVNRLPGGFTAETVEIKPEVRISSAVGEIQSSLFEGGQKAGLSDSQVMELANIFGWDIDFVLDIRQGDRFSVIFEEYLKHGEKIGDGAILAAEFVNQGKTYRALRFTGADGKADYYAEDGRSLRKAFLRTPVNFTRISSSFNLARRHPVLNTIRAHRGVDYAAPVGVPIKSTADGRVSFVGSKGGYGNTVILQHAGAYTTLYAHMSRFARGLKPGQRVEQGQIIGYVGKTGLASGPHLHYEFRVNGVHQDPVRVALPDGEPIKQSDLPRFRAQTTDMLVRIAALSGSTTVADSSQPESATLPQSPARPTAR